jgi:outer membrane lipoprotein SlyB
MSENQNEAATPEAPPTLAGILNGAKVHEAVQVEDGINLTVRNGRKQYKLQLRNTGALRVALQTLKRKSISVPVESPIGTV